MYFTIRVLTNNGLQLS